MGGTKTNDFISTLSGISLEHFLLSLQLVNGCGLHRWLSLTWLNLFHSFIKRRKFLYSGIKLGFGSYAQNFSITNDAGHRKVTDVNVGDVQHATDSKQLCMYNELNIIHEPTQHNPQCVQLCNNKSVPTKMKNKVS